MKYAVIQFSDGSFTVPAEGYTDKEKAIQAYHAHCNALFGDKNLKHCTVKLMDENLDVVEQKYIEVINREVAQTTQTIPQIEGE